MSHFEADVAFLFVALCRSASVNTVAALVQHLNISAALSSKKRIIRFSMKKCKSVQMFSTCGGRSIGESLIDELSAVPPAGVPLKVRAAADF